MKILILRQALGILCAAALFAPATILADDAEMLNGKWSVKKVNAEGQNITQILQINKDKFIFQIMSAENDLVLYATGAVKLEKLGPFSSVRFSDIRAGSSASDLNEVDDEYVSIYRLDEDSWTLASNFDKERQNKPSLDVYHRIKTSPPATTLVIDEIEIADTPQSATWFLCFEANVGGTNSRHYLQNKGYEKNQVTIPLALELPKVRTGQKCSFKLQLDDIDEDVCTDEVDNRSTGEFTATEKGSQTYSPESNWKYTIRWHLK
jgi:hypothetical protein